MKKKFKALIKEILTKEKTQSFIAYLAYIYIKFVYQTCRWKFKNKEIIDDYISQNKPLIIAFWHGHLLMMSCAWQRPTTFNMLISNHRDGKFISKISKIFGISVINGSTQRQGYAAARQIITKLKQGQVIGITPDGPRGPREQISDGVLQLARLTNADIVPVAYCCTNMKILNTWDKFRLALPFGKGVLVIGKTVTPVHDLEQLRITLQKAMEATVTEADQWFNK